MRKAEILDAASRIVHAVARRTEQTIEISIRPDGRVEVRGIAPRVVRADIHPESADPSLGSAWKAVDL